MKHTKGPWFNNKSVDLEEWLPCITTSPKEGQDNPAYNGDGLVMAIHPDFQPSESDARLIAAAPELLAALTECVNQCADFERMTDKCASAFRAARAAINKAKGE